MKSGTEKVGSGGCASILLTTEQTTPEQLITLNFNTLLPPHIGKRRVGRPRDNWVKVTILDYWEAIGNT